jgi:hypothetical protein
VLLPPAPAASPAAEQQCCQGCQQPRSGARQWGSVVDSDYRAAAAAATAAVDVSCDESLAAGPLLKSCEQHGLHSCNHNCTRTCQQVWF